MVVEDMFNNTFYPTIKQYIENNNNYSAKVTKVNPLDSKKFPIIPIKLLPVTNKYNNFSYSEETYQFGIEIDVYAMDTTIQETVTNNGVASVLDKKISKKTICDELTTLIVNYIKNNYHFRVKVTHDAPNIDNNVHRNIIRLNGTLDTKYGNDNLVIYPWLL